MSLGLLIAGFFAIVRVVRVRQSGLTRTALAAFVCLLVGTACEVVIISIDLYGAGDPQMIAGIMLRVVGDTVISVIPFGGVMMIAQHLRKFIGV